MSFMGIKGFFDIRASTREKMFSDFPPVGQIKETSFSGLVLEAADQLSFGGNLLLLLNFLTMQENEGKVHLQ